MAKVGSARPDADRGEQPTVADAVDQMASVNRTLRRESTKTVLNRTALVDATIAHRAESHRGAILDLGASAAPVIERRSPALAIPLSMCSATAMVQTRTSGNLMSLGAIDFGLLVDGAVIIVENCLRLFAEKQHQLGRPLTFAEHLEITYQGGKQVLRPAVFGRAIIITVYIPILFLTGIGEDVLADGDRHLCVAAFALADLHRRWSR
jgi:cobalt-zinc-cadmium resistance protein CzcA